MTFCREFHITPQEWAEQPADVVIRWAAYLRAEREGQEMARKIADAQGKARQH